MGQEAATLDLLRSGAIEVLGRISGSSNNALFVTVTTVDRSTDTDALQTIEAVYKPTIGERPLADFPDGSLTRREQAARLVSEATGWDIVPPTILRDGPFGEGMLQAFVTVDPEVDVMAMVLGDDPRLRRMAVFDAMVNNADRKGGHILPTDGGAHLHGVDHGVCFSTEPKLRTVLWGWRGTPLAPDELEGLSRVRDALASDLGDHLRSLLTRREVRLTSSRVDRLLATGRFPLPSPTWPAIPWPAF